MTSFQFEDEIREVSKEYLRGAGDFLKGVPYNRGHKVTEDWEAGHVHASIGVFQLAGQATFDAKKRIAIKKTVVETLSHRALDVEARRENISPLEKLAQRERYANWLGKFRVGDFDDHAGAVVGELEWITQEASETYGVFRLEANHDIDFDEVALRIGWGCRSEHLRKPHAHSVRGEIYAVRRFDSPSKRIVSEALFLTEGRKDAFGTWIKRARGRDGVAVSIAIGSVIENFAALHPKKIAGVDWSEYCRPKDEETKPARSLSLAF